LFKLLYRPKIEGKENIKNSGRIILAGNHTNDFDAPLLISSTKRNIHFLAKIELFRGIKKIFFDNMGLIPVDRSRKNHNVLENAYNYLKNENDINAELLKDCYYNSLSLALNDTTDPIRDKLIDLNLIDFLNMLESMEEEE
jgi:hypothetical protein